MKAANVALLCSIPLITLLTPVVKEKVAALLSLSNDISAYEGDGILIADTTSYTYVWWWWPRIFTTHWTLTQRPVFGDAHHTISFFVVPKNVAHRFLYRYDSNYESDYLFVDGNYMQVSLGQQHLDLRRNVYILPKEYTPGGEAKADVFRYCSCTNWGGDCYEWTLVIDELDYVKTQKGSCAKKEEYYPVYKNLTNSAGNSTVATVYVREGGSFDVQPLKCVYDTVNIALEDILLNTEKEYIEVVTVLANDIERITSTCCSL